MAQQTTSRTCVFCEGAIAASDPPEHIIPKWMRRFRPKGAVFDHHPGFIVRGDSSESQAPLPQFQSKDPGLTTDVVCHACNGHWMSDLEVRASRLLPPMIEGDGSPLTPDDQTFLAVWAIKTVMMWQTLHPNMRSIPLADYRWLKERRTPPPLTQVRIGRYVGTRLPFIQFSLDNLFEWNSPEPAPREFPPRGHRSILTIGQLVLEVFGSSDGNPVEPRFPNATGPAMLDTWPGLAAVYWPPDNAMNDARMMTFMDIPDDARRHRVFRDIE